MYLEQVIPAGPEYANTVDSPWRGLVTSDGWKYVCFHNQSWLMFNLAEDPYEQINVAFDPEYRQERKKLIARLKQWVADTKDNFVIPEN